MTYILGSLLNPDFQLYAVSERFMTKTCYILMRWFPPCTRPKYRVWFLYCYIYISLKQQFAGRHVTPLWHNSDCEPTSFTFTPWCCVLSGEATNINFIVYSLPDRYVFLKFMATVCINIYINVWKSSQRMNLRDVGSETSVNDTVQTNKSDK